MKDASCHERTRRAGIVQLFSTRVQSHKKYSEGKGSNMASTVHFRGQGVKITDSEVLIGRHPYARSDIQSVTVEERPMSTSQRITALVVGLVMLVIVGILPREAVYCDAPLTILALVAFYSAVVGTKTYILKVGTPDGEVLALSTTNQGQMRKAQEALERLVIQARQNSFLM